MPVSVGRHNLARIRKLLKLTQADIAQLVQCSPATIKAVEIGKLALSESLALRISHALGTQDVDWLLKNDLTAPLPAVHSVRGNQTNASARDAQTAVLGELFSRLFAVVAKMEKSQLRTMIEMHVEVELDALKKEKKAIPDCLPSTLTGSQSIEVFVRNPSLFDPDLRKWVNLKGLLKSNLELSVPWNDDENIDEVAKEAERGLQESKAIEKEVFAERSKRAKAMVKPFEKSRVAEAPSPKPRKARNRSRQTA